MVGATSERPGRSMAYRLGGVHLPISHQGVVVSVPVQEATPVLGGWVPVNPFEQLSGSAPRLSVAMPLLVVGLVNMPSTWYVQGEVEVIVQLKPFVAVKMACIIVAV